MQDCKSTQAPFDSQLLQLIKDDKQCLDMSILKSTSNAHQLVDNSGRTLLHYAAEHGNDKVAQYLTLLGADVDRQDCHGITPIVLAATSAMLDILLECNADIYIRDENGKCGLHRFLEPDYHGKFFEKFNSQHASDDEMARKLMDYNCSVYSAIKFRRAAVTRLLLERGCPLVPPNSYDRINGDALILAVDSLDLENARALLDFGVDVNAEGSDGYTPMSSRVICRGKNNRRLGMLRLLLERGADPTKIIARRLRPLTLDYYGRIFVHSGEMQMAAIVNYGTRATIRTLLEFDVDLHAQDSHGKTAIHYAMANESPGILEEFKGKECDANARITSGFERGSTFLHCVATTNFDAVKFLHASGADLNAVDRNGMTVLMRVWQNNEFGNGYLPYQLFNAAEIEQCSRVIDYLVYHGADPQAVTSKQHSIFRDVASRFKERLMEGVLIQLAIDEARGKPVVEIIRKQIDDDDYFLRDRFPRFKRLLGKMKKIRVWRSISLYQLIVGSDARIERYVRDEKFELYLHRRKSRNLGGLGGSYYSYVLRNRLAKALKVTKLRKKATTDLCRAFDLCHLVAEKIANYLGETELQNLYASFNDFSRNVRNNVTSRCL